VRSPADLAVAGVYFPGLHGLRFVAALAVVVAHIELLKSYHGYPNHADNLAIYELGRIAVTFFFVLSGFLITFLLLQEKRSAGRISIRKFYVRRALRIWPLYYSVVFLAFVVLPRVSVLHTPMISSTAAEHHTPMLALFVLLLPQVALSLYPPFPYAEPLWSIGVEEQFYLFWPVIVASAKKLVPWLIGVTVAGLYRNRSSPTISLRLSEVCILIPRSQRRRSDTDPHWRH
jgi:peptidoglycan/LPS O-acetylase OafA/YrhL